ncbi:cleavage and polyadenylation specificity factor [Rhodotorula toruloides]
MLRIAVIGATGQQGSGVVSALLKTADYAGTYGVFFASPSIPAGQEDAQNSEEAKQGRGVVDAAKAAGCQHFVYSGLNSMKEVSGGKRTHCTHWDAKALQAVTILIPGGFYTNLDLPLWTRRDPDGTAVFCLPVKPDAQMQWVDERFDMGNFVTGTLAAPHSVDSTPHTAVFKRGPRITGGKTYPVMDDVLTPVDMAKQYQTVTGEPAKFEPLAVEEYLDSVRTDPEMGGPEFAKEVEDWVHHINAIKPGTTCTGATFQDLGVKATTFDNWLERTGWRVGGTEDK